MKEETLPPTYDPKKAEAKWYAFWEQGQFFKADAGSKKPSYTIVMPPPNVTGVLHMGHALVNTLQDILIRWKRMSGYEALWVPGTDHAGIATQTVVERHLMATEKKRRDAYSREDFLKIVWDWKEKSEKTILSQLKALGCSCDWSRLCFTMDSSRTHAVNKLFKELFEAGLIYRGSYLVNWDPITQTALADDEVEYEEREGFLWYFKYPLIEETGYIRIATTRPETLLGDTAIAVSPKDGRYAHLIGYHVRVPFVERQIPIIADHHVDPEFGTGMVKVTPAHDPQDYRMGLEHQLPMINILTPDGHINENGGAFQGLSREEARQAIVEQMGQLGLLDKVERHRLRVGVSYRSKAVIEPYLSKQWFIRMEPFISPLRESVEKTQVALLPKTWEATYFHWINHLRDWCISRQLWWGHRIPVWYRKDQPENMLCYAEAGLPPQVVENPELWEQDPDVLDTWFSSALWPLSTLGWPELTADVQKFYPTQVLVTGHDILFFWVARMILVGQYLTGRPPFSEVFLHGLIYGKSYWQEGQEGRIRYITGDEKLQYDLGTPLPKGVLSRWEKLSKSKGNVIDPLEMCATYGTDAVRMALCSCANQSPQIDLDRRRFEEFKHFANKIWNGARFVFLNLKDLSSEELAAGMDRSMMRLEDLWILSRLNQVNRDLNGYLERYAFDQAAATAYHFFWNELCAYYLELSKASLQGSGSERKHKQKLLVTLLCNTVCLLHPMAPFITEELFQLLKAQFPAPFAEPSSVRDPYTEATLRALKAPACLVAPYPGLIHSPDINAQVEERFQFLEMLIHTIRTIRAEMKIPPQMATQLYLVGDWLENRKWTQEELEPMVRAFVNVPQVTLCKEPPLSGFAATGLVGPLRIYIPLPRELAAQEKKRLEKELEKTEQSVTKLQQLLANPNFHSRADSRLIEKQQQALVQIEEQRRLLQEKLEQLQN